MLPSLCLILVLGLFLPPQTLGGFLSPPLPVYALDDTEHTFVFDTVGLHSLRIFQYPDVTNLLVTRTYEEGSCVLVWSDLVTGWGLISGSSVRLQLALGTDWANADLFDIALSSPIHLSTFRWDPVGSLCLPSGSFDRETRLFYLLLNCPDETNLVSYSTNTLNSFTIPGVPPMDGPLPAFEFGAPRAATYCRGHHWFMGRNPAQGLSTAELVLVRMSNEGVVQYNTDIVYNNIGGVVDLWCDEDHGVLIVWPDVTSCVYYRVSADDDMDWQSFSSTECMAWSVSASIRDYTYYYTQNELGGQKAFRKALMYPETDIGSTLLDQDPTVAPALTSNDQASWAAGCYVVDDVMGGGFLCVFLQTTETSLDVFSIIDDHVIGPLDWSPDLYGVDPTTISSFFSSYASPDVFGSLILLANTTSGVAVMTFQYHGLVSDMGNYVPILSLTDAKRVWTASLEGFVSPAPLVHSPLQVTWKCDLPLNTKVVVSVKTIELVHLSTISTINSGSVEFMDFPRFAVPGRGLVVSVDTVHSTWSTIVVPTPFFSNEFSIPLPTTIRVAFMYSRYCMDSLGNMYILDNEPGQQLLLKLNLLDNVPALYYPIGSSSQDRSSHDRIDTPMAMQRTDFTLNYWEPSNQIVVVFGTELLGIVPTYQQNMLLIDVGPEHIVWSKARIAGTVPGRINHCSVTIDNHLYVYGGKEDGDQVTSEILLVFRESTSSEYDFVRVSDPYDGEPPAAVSHACAAIDGSMVIWGGWDVVGVTKSNSLIQIVKGGHGIGDKYVEWRVLDSSTYAADHSLSAEAGYALTLAGSLDHLWVSPISGTTAAHCRSLTSHRHGRVTISLFDAEAACEKNVFLINLQPSRGQVVRVHFDPSDTGVVRVQQIRHSSEGAFRADSVTAPDVASLFPVVRAPTVGSTPWNSYFSDFSTTEVSQQGDFDMFDYFVQFGDDTHRFHIWSLTKYGGINTYWSTDHTDATQTSNSQVRWQVTWDESRPYCLTYAEYEIYSQLCFSLYSSGTGDGKWANSMGSSYDSRTLEYDIAWMCNIDRNTVYQQSVDGVGHYIDAPDIHPYHELSSLNNMDVTVTYVAPYFVYGPRAVLDAGDMIIRFATAGSHDGADVSLVERFIVNMADGVYSFLSIVDMFPLKSSGAVAVFGTRKEIGGSFASNFVAIVSPGGSVSSLYPAIFPHDVVESPRGGIIVTYLEASGVADNIYCVLTPSRSGGLFCSTELTYPNSRRTSLDNCDTSFTARDGDVSFMMSACRDSVPDTNAVFMGMFSQPWPTYVSVDTAKEEQAFLPLFPMMDFASDVYLRFKGTTTPIRDFADNSDSLIEVDFEGCQIGASNTMHVCDILYAGNYGPSDEQLSLRGIVEVEVVMETDYGQTVHPIVNYFREKQTDPFAAATQGIVVPIGVPVTDQFWDYHVLFPSDTSLPPAVFHFYPAQTLCVTELFGAQTRHDLMATFPPDIKTRFVAVEDYASEGFYVFGGNPGNQYYVYALKAYPVDPELSYDNGGSDFLGGPHTGGSTLSRNFVGAVAMPWVSVDHFELSERTGVFFVLSAIQLSTYTVYRSMLVVLHDNLAETTLTADPTVLTACGKCYSTHIGSGSGNDFVPSSVVASAGLSEVLIIGSRDGYVALQRFDESTCSIAVGAVDYSNQPSSTFVNLYLLGEPQSLSMTIIEDTAEPLLAVASIGPIDGSNVGSLRFVRLTPTGFAIEDVVHELPMDTSSRYSHQSMIRTMENIAIHAMAGSDTFMLSYHIGTASSPMHTQLFNATTKRALTPSLIVADTPGDIYEGVVKMDSGLVSGRPVYSVGYPAWTGGEWRIQVLVIDLWDQLESVVPADVHTPSTLGAVPVFEDVEHTYCLSRDEFYAPGLASGLEFDIHLEGVTTLPEGTIPDVVWNSATLCVQLPALSAALLTLHLNPYFARTDSYGGVFEVQFSPDIYSEYNLQHCSSIELRGVHPVIWSSDYFSSFMLGDKHALMGWVEDPSPTIVIANAFLLVGSGTLEMLRFARIDTSSGAVVAAAFLHRPLLADSAQALHVITAKADRILTTRQIDLGNALTLSDEKDVLRVGVGRSVTVTLHTEGLGQYVVLNALSTKSQYGEYLHSKRFRGYESPSGYVDASISSPEFGSQYAIAFLGNSRIYTASYDAISNKATARRMLAIPFASAVCAAYAGNMTALVYDNGSFVNVQFRSSDLTRVISEFTLYGRRNEESYEVTESKRPRLSCGYAGTDAIWVHMLSVGGQVVRFVSGSRGQLGPTAFVQSAASVWASVDYSYKYRVLGIGRQIHQPATDQSSVELVSISRHDFDNLRSGFAQLTVFSYHPFAYDLPESMFAEKEGQAWQAVGMPDCMRFEVSGVSRRIVPSAIFLHEEGMECEGRHRIALRSVVSSSDSSIGVGSEFILDITVVSPDPMWIDPIYDEVQVLPLRSGGLAALLRLGSVHTLAFNPYFSPGFTSGYSRELPESESVESVDMYRAAVSVQYWDRIYVARAFETLDGSYSVVLMCFDDRFLRWQTALATEELVDPVEMLIFVTERVTVTYDPDVVTVAVQDEGCLRVFTVSHTGSLVSDSDFFCPTEMSQGNWTLRTLSNLVDNTYSAASMVVHGGPFETLVISVPIFTAPGDVAANVQNHFEELRIMANHGASYCWADDSVYGYGCEHVDVNQAVDSPTGYLTDMLWSRESSVSTLAMDYLPVDDPDNPGDHYYMAATLKDVGVSGIVGVGIDLLGWEFDMSVPTDVHENIMTVLMDGVQYVDVSTNNVTQNTTLKLQRLGHDGRTFVVSYGRTYQVFSIKTFRNLVAEDLDSRLYIWPRIISPGGFLTLLTMTHTAPVISFPISSIVLRAISSFTASGNQYVYHVYQVPSSAPSVAEERLAIHYTNAPTLSLNQSAYYEKRVPVISKYRHFCWTDTFSCLQTRLMASGNGFIYRYEEMEVDGIPQSVIAAYSSADATPVVYPVEHDIIQLAWHTTTNDLVMLTDEGHVRYFGLSQAPERILSGMTFIRLTASPTSGVIFLVTFEGDLFTFGPGTGSCRGSNAGNEGIVSTYAAYPGGTKPLKVVHMRDPVDDLVAVVTADKDFVTCGWYGDEERLVRGMSTSQSGHFGTGLPLTVYVTGARNDVRHAIDVAASMQHGGMAIIGYMVTYSSEEWIWGKDGDLIRAGTPNNPWDSGIVSNIVAAAVTYNDIFVLNTGSAIIGYTIFVIRGGSGGWWYLDHPNTWMLQSLTVDLHQMGDYGQNNQFLRMNPANPTLRDVVPFEICYLGGEVTFLFTELVAVPSILPGVLNCELKNFDLHYGSDLQAVTMYCAAVSPSEATVMVTGSLGYGVAEDFGNFYNPLELTLDLTDPIRILGPSNGNFAKHLLPSPIWEILYKDAHLFDWRFSLFHVGTGHHYFADYVVIEEDQTTIPWSQIASYPTEIISGVTTLEICLESGEEGGSFCTGEQFEIVDSSVRTLVDIRNDEYLTFDDDKSGSMFAWSKYVYRVSRSLGEVKAINVETGEISVRRSGHYIEGTYASCISDTRLYVIPEPSETPSYDSGDIFWIELDPTSEPDQGERKPQTMEDPWFPDIVIPLSSNAMPISCVAVTDSVDQVYLYYRGVDWEGNPCQDYGSIAIWSSNDFMWNPFSGGPSGYCEGSFFPMGVSSSQAAWVQLEFVFPYLLFPPMDSAKLWFYNHITTTYIQGYVEVTDPDGVSPPGIVLPEDGQPQLCKGVRGGFSTLGNSLFCLSQDTDDIPHIFGADFSDIYAPFWFKVDFVFNPEFAKSSFGGSSPTSVGGTFFMFDTLHVGPPSSFINMPHIYALPSVAHCDDTFSRFRISYCSEKTETSWVDLVSDDVLGEYMDTCIDFTDALWLSDYPEGTLTSSVKLTFSDFVSFSEAEGDPLVFYVSYASLYPHWNSSVEVLPSLDSCSPLIDGGLCVPESEFNAFQLRNSEEGSYWAHSTSYPATEPVSVYFHFANVVRLSAPKLCIQLRTVVDPEAAIDTAAVPTRVSLSFLPLNRNSGAYSGTGSSIGSQGSAVTELFSNFQPIQFGMLSEQISHLTMFDNSGSAILSNGSFIHWGTDSVEEEDAPTVPQRFIMEDIIQDVQYFVYSKSLDSTTGLYNALAVAGNGTAVFFTSYPTDRQVVLSPHPEGGVFILWRLLPNDHRYKTSVIAVDADRQMWSLGRYLGISDPPSLGVAQKWVARDPLIRPISISVFVLTPNSRITIVDIENQVWYAETANVGTCSFRPGPADEFMVVPIPSSAGSVVRAVSNADTMFVLNALGEVFTHSEDEWMRMWMTSDVTGDYSFDLAAEYASYTFVDVALEADNGFLMSSDYAVYATYENNELRTLVQLRVPGCYGSSPAGFGDAGTSVVPLYMSCYETPAPFVETCSTEYCGTDVCNLTMCQIANFESEDILVFSLAEVIGAHACDERGFCNITFTDIPILYKRPVLTVVAGVSSVPSDPFYVDTVAPSADDVLASACGGLTSITGSNWGDGSNAMEMTFPVQTPINYINSTEFELELEANLALAPHLLRFQVENLEPVEVPIQYDGSCQDASGWNSIFHEVTVSYSANTEDTNCDIIKVKQILAVSDTTTVLLVHCGANRGYVEMFDIENGTIWRMGATNWWPYEAAHDTVTNSFYVGGKFNSAGISLPGCTVSGFSSPAPSWTDGGFIVRVDADGTCQWSYTFSQKYWTGSPTSVLGPSNRPRVITPSSIGVFFAFSIGGDLSNLPMLERSQVFDHTSGPTEAFAPIGMTDILIELDPNTGERKSGHQWLVVDATMDMFTSPAIIDQININMATGRIEAVHTMRQAATLYSCTPRYLGIYSVGASGEGQASNLERVHPHIKAFVGMTVFSQADRQADANWIYSVTLLTASYAHFRPLRSWVDMDTRIFSIQYVRNNPTSRVQYLSPAMFCELDYQTFGTTFLPADHNAEVFGSVSFTMSEDWAEIVDADGYAPFKLGVFNFYVSDYDFTPADNHFSSCINQVSFDDENRDPDRRFVLYDSNGYCLTSFVYPYTDQILVPYPSYPSALETGGFFFPVAAASGPVDIVKMQVQVPRVISVSVDLFPNTAGGDEVVMNLFGLADSEIDVEVSVGDNLVFADWFNETHLGFTTPAGQGSDLLITAKQGIQSFPSTLTVRYVPPVILSLDSGLACDTRGGCLLEISGTNFGTAPVVYVGGFLCPTVTSTHLYVGCTVPTGFGNVDVELFAGNQGSNSLTYQYGLPYIDSVYPPSGPLRGGVPITILGGNFGYGLDAVANVNGELFQGIFANHTWVTFSDFVGDVVDEEYPVSLVVGGAESTSNGYFMFYIGNSEHCVSQDAYGWCQTSSFSACVPGSQAGPQVVECDMKDWYHKTWSRAQVSSLSMGLSHWLPISNGTSATLLGGNLYRCSFEYQGEMPAEVTITSYSGEDPLVDFSDAGDYVDISFDAPMPLVFAEFTVPTQCAEYLGYSSIVSPVSLHGPINQLGFGSHHAIALLRDGTLVSWGESEFCNLHGQTGNGAFHLCLGSTYTIALTYGHFVGADYAQRQLYAKFPLNGVSTFATAGNYTAAIANRTVFEFGMLGDGIRQSFAAIPVCFYQEPDFDRCPLAISGAEEVAVGDTFVVVQMSDDTVLAYGDWLGLSDSQLPFELDLPVGSPVLSIAAASAPAILLEDGRIFQYVGLINFPVANITAGWLLSGSAELLLAMEGTTVYQIAIDGSVITLPHLANYSFVTACREPIVSDLRYRGVACGPDGSPVFLTDLPAVVTYDIDGINSTVTPTSGAVVTMSTVDASFADVEFVQVNHPVEMVELGVDYATMVIGANTGTVEFVITLGTARPVYLDVEFGRPTLTSVSPRLLSAAGGSVSVVGNNMMYSSNMNCGEYDPIPCSQTVPHFGLECTVPPLNLTTSNFTIECELEYTYSILGVPSVEFLELGAISYQTPVIRAVSTSYRCSDAFCLELETEDFGCCFGYFRGDSILNGVLLSDPEYFCVSIHAGGVICELSLTLHGTNSISFAVDSISSNTVSFEGLSLTWDCISSDPDACVPYSLVADDDIYYVLGYPLGNDASLIKLCTDFGCATADSLQTSVSSVQAAKFSSQPPGAGIRNVWLEVDGAHSPGMQLLFYPPPAIITTFPAGSGSNGGILLTVTGEFFGKPSLELSEVYVGNQPCLQTMRPSDGQLLCVVPAGWGIDLPVTVLTSGSSTVNTTVFNAFNYDRPWVRSIGPKSVMAAPDDQLLVVFGENLFASSGFTVVCTEHPSGGDCSASLLDISHASSSDEILLLRMKFDGSLAGGMINISLAGFNLPLFETSAHMVQVVPSGEAAVFSENGLHDYPFVVFRDVLDSSPPVLNLTLPAVDIFDGDYADYSGRYCLSLMGMDAEPTCALEVDQQVFASFPPPPNAILQFEALAEPAVGGIYPAYLPYNSTGGGTEAVVAIWSVVEFTRIEPSIYVSADVPSTITVRGTGFIDAGVTELRMSLNGGVVFSPLPFTLFNPSTFVMDVPPATHTDVEITFDGIQWIPVYILSTLKYYHFDDLEPHLLTSEVTTVLLSGYNFPVGSTGSACVDGVYCVDATFDSTTEGNFVSPVFDVGCYPVTVSSGVQTVTVSVGQVCFDELSIWPRVVPRDATTTIVLRGHHVDFPTEMFLFLGDVPFELTAVNASCALAEISAGSVSSQGNSDVSVLIPAGDLTHTVSSVYFHRSPSFSHVSPSLWDPHVVGTHDLVLSGDIDVSKPVWAIVDPTEEEIPCLADGADIRCVMSAGADLLADEMEHNVTFSVTYNHRDVFSVPFAVRYFHPVVDSVVPSSFNFRDTPMLEITGDFPYVAPLNCIISAGDMVYTVPATFSVSSAQCPMVHLGDPIRTLHLDLQYVGTDFVYGGLEMLTTSGYSVECAVDPLQAFLGTSFGNLMVDATTFTEESLIEGKNDTTVLSEFDPCCIGDFSTGDVIGSAACGIAFTERSGTIIVAVTLAEPSVVNLVTVFSPIPCIHASGQFRVKSVHTSDWHGRTPSDESASGIVITQFYRTTSSLVEPAIRSTPPAACQSLYGPLGIIGVCDTEVHFFADQVIFEFDASLVTSVMSNIEADASLWLSGIDLRGISLWKAYTIRIDAPDVYPEVASAQQVDFNVECFLQNYVMSDLAADDPTSHTVTVSLVQLATGRIMDDLVEECSGVGAMQVVSSNGVASFSLCVAAPSWGAYQISASSPDVMVDGYLQFNVTPGVATGLAVVHESNLRSIGLFARRIEVDMASVPSPGILATVDASGSVLVGVDGAGHDIDISIDSFPFNDNSFATLETSTIAMVSGQHVVLVSESALHLARPGLYTMCATSSGLVGVCWDLDLLPADATQFIVSNLTDNTVVAQVGGFFVLQGTLNDLQGNLVNLSDVSVSVSLHDDSHQPPSALAVFSTTSRRGLFFFDSLTVPLTAAGGKMAYAGMVFDMRISAISDTLEDFWVYNLSLAECNEFHVLDTDTKVCVCDKGAQPSTSGICSPCPANWYKEYIGDYECLECDVTRKTYPGGRVGAVLRDECKCISHVFIEVNGFCLPCPDEGAVCEQGELVSIEPGYWVDLADPTSAIPCRSASSCQGSLVTSMTLNGSLCAMGHDGPLCATCLEGYAMSVSGICQESAHDGNLVALLVFTAKFLVYLILCHIFIRRKSAKILHGVSLLGLPHPASVFKAFIAHFQRLVSLIHLASRTNLQRFITNYLLVITPFVFDFRILFRFSPVTAGFLLSLSPLIIVVLLVLVALIVKPKYKPTWTNLTIATVYLIVPSAVHCAASMIPCTDFGSFRMLTFDPSVECGTHSHVALGLTGVAINIALIVILGGLVYMAKPTKQITRDPMDDIPKPPVFLEDRSIHRKKAGRKKNEVTEFKLSSRHVRFITFGLVPASRMYDVTALFGRCLLLAMAGGLRETASHLELFAILSLIIFELTVHIVLHPEGFERVHVITSVSFVAIVISLSQWYLFLDTTLIGSLVGIVGELGVFVFMVTMLIMSLAYKHKGGKR